MELEEYVLKSTEREFLSKFSGDIGQKAQGLFECNSEFVPKFLVISSSLFVKWHNNEDVKCILESIQQLAHKYFSNNSLIIRSSAKRESSDERGFYESSLGKIKKSEICEEIIKLWKANVPKITSIPNNNFSIIIQQYIEPTYIGHLSNERHLTKEKKTWYYEILKPDGSYSKSEYITLKQSEIRISPNCNSVKSLIEILRQIGSMYLDNRYHFEWVWDNNRIWIVQKDKELININTHKPGSEWIGKLTKIIDSNKYELECLNTVKTTKNIWGKIECIKTFISCDLPYGEIYILEGQEILQNILNEIYPKSLLNDLNWLIKSPIIIRMDINDEKKSRTLLPRTETLHNIDEVKEFICKNLTKFSSEKISFENICFLFHRFIISNSCAFALSKPNIPRARIDSTWGIVDGLYFHPHDSFEVQKGDTFSCQKGIRCKTEYLDINSNGNWISIKSGKDYDWKESLSKKELETILEFNLKIANSLKKEVTVMYFVDIFKETGYPSILPWFYSTEDISDSSEKFTDTVFSSKRIIITNHSEFDKLKQNFYFIKEKNRISIILKLKPELLRDREFIETIGNFSYQKKIPIILEGSILSHPYYILRKQKAIVQVKNQFEPNYQKQTFYKLVRDKIPILIKSKGENVKTISITSEQTLELIKQKIIEESYEFFWEVENDNLMEELADIYELIRSASKIFDTSIDEVKAIADKKRETKGGFDSGIYLIETQEKALIEIINNIQDSKLEIDEMNIIDNTNKQLPRHKGSYYDKGTINLSYIPALFDFKTKKRIEIVSSSLLEIEHIIEHTKDKNVIKLNHKKKENDINQLSFNFDNT